MPIDWSEHRQPMMYTPGSGRVLFWMYFTAAAIAVAVIALLGDPHKSEASAVVLAISVGGIPAAMAAHALRRRKPPLRFGIPATILISTVIWAAFAGYLFIRTYQS